MAEENLGLDLASQTGQENIVEAITNLSKVIQNKPMGGGGGSSDGDGGDSMNLMDLYYIGYNSYTYHSKTLMDKYYEDDDLVNSFEIAGYLLEYGISSSAEIGKFFKRFTDIDTTVDWDSLTSISDVAGDTEAVTAILANNYAKNAISMSPSALAAFASLDSTNQIITDRVIYLCGLRLGLYGSYNEFIAKDVNKLLIADSPDAVNYFIGDSTRLAILFGNTDTVIQILKNPSTKQLLLGSSTILNLLSNDTSVMTRVTGSRSMMKEFVKSPSVMTVLAGNSTFMSAVVSDPDVLAEIDNNFGAVGAIVIGTKTSLSAIMASTVAKNLFAANDTAVMYILEQWSGITLGNPDYETLADVLEVVCVNPNALISLESASQNWNDFSRSIFLAINQSGDRVIDIFNTLSGNTDRFTAGAIINQDNVDSANNSCAAKGKYYACHLDRYNASASNVTTTLFINGESMGTGARAINNGQYGVNAETVNAIGIGPSTFTEQGDGIVSVIPYTIITQ
jgi:hypothetical protein